MKKSQCNWPYHVTLSQNTHTHAHTHTHTHTHAHTHTHTHTHTCMHTHMHTFAHTHTYTLLHLHSQLFFFACLFVFGLVCFVLFLFVSFFGGEDCMCDILASTVPVCILGKYIYLPVLKISHPCPYKTLHPRRLYVCAAVRFIHLIF